MPGLHNSKGIHIELDRIIDMLNGAIDSRNYSIQKIIADEI